MKTRHRETREEGAYTFHYDRRERLATGGVDRDGAPARKGGIFKRNRSLAIVVIDLLVILLVFGLYRFFWAPTPHLSRIAEHSLTLVAFEFGSDIYVTLRIEAEDGSAGAPVTVEFEAGDESALVQDVLPGSGSKTTVRAILSMGRNARVDAVGATVTVGEQSVSLSANIEEE